MRYFIWKLEFFSNILSALVGPLPSIKRSLCFLQNRFISCRSKVIYFKRNQISQSYGKNVPLWKFTIMEFPKVLGGIYWPKSFQIWYIFKILSKNKFLKKCLRGSQILTLPSCLSFCRSIHWRRSMKKPFFKVSQYSQENTYVAGSVLENTCDLFYRCFPVNIVKFFRTPILKNICKRFLHNYPTC